MVNYPSGISDCDSQNPVLLDLFLSSDASICSTKACPPLGNSGYVVVSVYIDFQSNSKGDALSHCIAYDYSCADWDGLHNHLRDVPGEDTLGLVLLILLVNSQAGIDLYNPHLKYVVKPHSSLWFSAACAAAMVHKNHCFDLYQQNKYSESKGKVDTGY